MCEIKRKGRPRDPFSQRGMGGPEPLERQAAGGPSAQATSRRIGAQHTSIYR